VTTSPPTHCGAGGFLAPELYRTYVFANLKRYWDCLKDAGKKAVEAAGGQVSLLGGISNIEALLQGTPEDVYKQARYNIEAGIDSIGPECAISLHTPMENLKAIIAAAEEGY